MKKRILQTILALIAACVALSPPVPGEGEGVWSDAFEPPAELAEFALPAPEEAECGASPIEAPEEGEYALSPAELSDEGEYALSPAQLSDEGEYALSPAEPPDAAPTPAPLPVRLKLGVGEKYALDLSALADAPDLRFKSSKKKVATVSKGGVIKARKRGKAVVKAYGGDKALYRCEVRVLKAPKRVKLTPASAALNVGETLALSAKLPDGSASQIAYASSNAAVAAVDALGTVTAVGPGEAVITAETYNGKRAGCAVTVAGPPPATPAPTPRPDPIIAVMGDSITAYRGLCEDATMWPGTYAPFYPNEYVGEVSLMWWDIVRRGLGSGTLPAMSALGGSGFLTNVSIPAAYEDFRIVRLGMNGTPDYILVCLGTNDKFAIHFGANLHTADAGILYAARNTLYGACALSLVRLKRAYPASRIVVLVPGVSVFPNYIRHNLDDACDIIAEVAEEIGVYRVIDLRDCGITAATIWEDTFDGSHPTASGMEKMANYILKCLGR